MDADAWIQWGDESVPVWLVSEHRTHDVFIDENRIIYEVKK